MSFPSGQLLMQQLIADESLPLSTRLQAIREPSYRPTLSFLLEMHDYDTQKWFDLYKTALLELKRAAMTGRIANARAEITTRLEMLQQHPELHHTELSAIQDALNNLRVLEREEERLAAEDKKRILQQTVQKLKSIAPRFGESDQQ